MRRLFHVNAQARRSLLRWPWLAFTHALVALAMVSLCACERSAGVESSAEDAADEEESTASPEACHDTCASTGAICGTVCGELCGGSCPAGQACTLGQCVCEPKCDGTRCDDGCGGSCDCTDGTFCQPDGACVPAEACTSTCESAGVTCGSVCGQACGSCGAGEVCDDGSCASALGCLDCALKLRLLSQERANGKRTIVMAIDYAPGDAEVRPRIADLRVRTDGAARLVSVKEEDALTRAHKDLYTDSSVTDGFRRRADGSYQMLLYGFANTDEFEPGQLLTLTFTVAEEKPVSFWFERREQTFAPPTADAALQASAYAQKVVVTP